MISWWCAHSRQYSCISSGVETSKRQSLPPGKVKCCLKAVTGLQDEPQDGLWLLKAHVLVLACKEKQGGCCAVMSCGCQAKQF